MNNPSSVEQLREMRFSAMANEFDAQLKDPATYAQIPFEDRFGLLVNPEMGNKWDRSFWARGYYVSTVGNVDEETVKEYIRRQTEESMNEDKKTYSPL